jgi:hypothetical protein
MNRLIKFIAIFFGIVFTIVAAAGVYLGYSALGTMEEAKQEAELFAQNASKEQCLEQYIERYLACEEMSCYFSVTSFGVTCLEAASGSTENFCRDKPKSQIEVYRGDWKDGLCKSKGMDTQSCLNVYKIIEVHCGN